MNSEAVKESRQALRRVQDHLYQAHSSLSAQCESVGLVDVFYHPSSTLPSLNYVTPRRGTAWVSGEMVAQGLARMRQLRRGPRVTYIEGLFPPLFASALAELGLHKAWKLPLMVYRKEGFSGQTPCLPRLGRMPNAITIGPVNDQRGAHLWSTVWHHPDYRIITLGVEPLLAGPDHHVLKQGLWVDLLMQRADVPLGLARLSIQGDVAHVLALALTPEAAAPKLLRRLLVAIIRTAQAKGCTLIYAPGDSEAEQQMARALGFRNFGSMVGYTAAVEPEIHEVHDDYILGQPVLALR